MCVLMAGLRRLYPYPDSRTGEVVRVLFILDCVQSVVLGIIIKAYYRDKNRVKRCFGSALEAGYV